jgi:ribosomal protein L14
MRFTKNAVVLVDKNNTPLGKRIKAAIPIELANRYPQFGLIAKRIV